MSIWSTRAFPQCSTHSIHINYSWDRECKSKLFYYMYACMTLQGVTKTNRELLDQANRGLQRKKYETEGQANEILA